jgi:hypothetical protein
VLGSLKKFVSKFIGEKKPEKPQEEEKKHEPAKPYIEGVRDKKRAGLVYHIWCLKRHDNKMMARRRAKNRMARRSRRINNLRKQKICL